MSGPGRPVLPPEGEADFLTAHPFGLTRTPLPDGVLVEPVRIPLPDGVVLAGTVYRPDAAGAVPVITTSTPYGKDRFDQWEYFRDAPDGNVPGGGGFYLGPVTVSDHTAFEAPDPGFWVPHGYAVLLVDHPGLGSSGSNPGDDPGIESRWRDVMAWLAEQDWCTGKVGMSGVSALCITQWMAAKAPAPPQLAAIIPWEGYTESGPGGGFGGIPETAFRAWIRSVWIRPNVNRDAAGPEPALNDWHHDVESIGVPALVCASFSDQELHTWDSFDAFTRIASRHKWLYTHRRQKWGAFYGREELALQKRFLDRFLKDSGDDMADVPTVHLEVNERRDVFTVRPARQWPVENTHYAPLYLDVVGRQLKPEPAAVPGVVQFAPAPVDDVGNRAVFDHVFTADTDVVGYMALTLHVEALDTADADLFVGVEKLDADGNEVYFFSGSGGNANGPVTRGWLRASRRAVNEKSTPGRPVPDLSRHRPLRPGEVVRVEIPLMPSATRFRAGETLRLVVQAWSRPGQWEGGPTLQWDALRAGRTRLHTGPDHPARLLLPVLAPPTEG